MADPNLVPLVDYGRSSRGGRGWQCPRCHTYNIAVVGRIFNTPPFECSTSGCGETYLRQHDLDFSLADVKVNRLPLVTKIFCQKGPECVENGLCQMLQTNHNVDKSFKNEYVNSKHPMRKLNPHKLYVKYCENYPAHESCGRPDAPAFNHKILKMLHSLRKDGILHEVGKRSNSKAGDDTRISYKVGDVTFIDAHNYEQICKELANGIPLLANILPGFNFGQLKYGQFYTPPAWTNTLVEKLHRCDDLHKQLLTHASHMVVLVGPGTNHETGEQGFWAVNSWKNWCERDKVPGYAGPFVKQGVGLIPHHALGENVVKLWQPGESAAGDPFRLVDELDNVGNMSVRARNFYMLEGDLRNGIPDPWSDPALLYCPHRKDKPHYCYEADL